MTTMLIVLIWTTVMILLILNLEGHVASRSGILSNVNKTDKSEKTRKSKVVKGVKRLLKYHPKKKFKA